MYLFNECILEIKYINLERFKHTCNKFIQPCPITMSLGKKIVFAVGNPNRKKMRIFGFVGIFEFIC